MRIDKFKAALCKTATSYAIENGFPFDDRWASALIFDNLAENFNSESYAAIIASDDWLRRTLKQHSQVAGAMEMQSSNSSDALLMSIFCHPRLKTWKGIADLLGFIPGNPDFGVKARVAKLGTEGDETEIDMALGDCFFEAKLTEEGFTEKAFTEVMKYTDFERHFNVKVMPQVDGRVQNYQVIRNLLAAIQHDRKHILLCDERRPDLVLQYMETVACLREIDHRMRCRVVFWQDIARVSGGGLKEFLFARYGIE